MPPYFFAGSRSTIPATALQMRDDLGYSTSALYNKWFFQTSGGGSVVNNPSGLTSNQWLATTLRSSGIAGNTCGISRFLARYKLGARFWQFNHGVVFPVLSVPADRYIARVGLGDLANAEPNNGIYFEYTDNAAGGDWQCVTANGGVRTKFDSNVTVAAATRYGLKAYAFDNTQAIFVINGRVITVQSANFPVASLGEIFQLTKSVGAIGDDMVCEYAGFAYGVSR